MVHDTRPMSANADAIASAVNNARRVPRDVVRALANIGMHAANSAHRSASAITAPAPAECGTKPSTAIVAIASAPATTAVAGCDEIEKNRLIPCGVSQEGGWTRGKTRRGSAWTTGVRQIGAARGDDARAPVSLRVR